MPCDLGKVAQLLWEGNLQRGQITWKLPWDWGADRLPGDPEEEGK